MKISLADALTELDNFTETDNGAGAYKSTTSHVLDLFARGSAIRELAPHHQAALFSDAWAENHELALKAMFYARDIRGGQGQRDAFRWQLRYLAGISPDTVRKNLHLIPEYGRWDDLYILVGTKVEADVFDLIKKQLDIDLKSDNPSLLAKWLKSENASSPETKRMATKTRIGLGMTPRDYRKMLSNLRNKINIVESHMSSNHWDHIGFSQVPSQAMMKYRTAFARHQPERFQKFIDKVNRGEESINSGTLYPCDIVSKIGAFESRWDRFGIDPELANAMWDNLPDYLNGNDENAIVVVDTSGSMQGQPINVAVSLGIYFAERAKGEFHNKFITFTDIPSLVTLKGNDITSKVKHVATQPWGRSTNLEAVYNLILNAARRANVPDAEMIKKIIIVSDMQFNRAIQGNNTSTLYQRMQALFAQHGYTVPNVVFWNVKGRANNQPVQANEKGVALVSGYSPSILEYVMGGELKSPYDTMMDVLCSDRYAPLKV